ncbi:MAG TPA: MerR family transcriptional regulator [Mycobacteriales bacterium]|nr:MerR family transcriptional regulator [Mycobacteriales bacterium]
MNDGRTSYTVGQVADLAGVTIRALRHYDEIGLLPPSGRSEAGYRHYASGDLERLSRILFYRELGFTLEQIATILDDPDADANEHLRRQLALLRRRIGRSQEMVAAVERALEANRMGTPLTPEEQFEMFGDVFFTEDGFTDVTGDNDQYRESTAKAASFTRQDWQRVMAAERGILERLAQVMASGAAADSTAAANLAEEYRSYMGQYFTACTPGELRDLCASFPGIPKYRATFEAVAPGLTEYLRDAASANAERHPG